MGFCEKKNKRSEKKKEFNTSSLLLIVTNFFLVFLDIYFAEGHINLPGSWLQGIHSELTVNVASFIYIWNSPITRKSCLYYTDMNFR